MNSIKCPECGLVNFASAPECKRCHLKFHQPERVSETSPAVDEQNSDAVPAETPNPEPTAAASQPFSPAPLPKHFDADAPGLNAPTILFVVYLLLSVGVFVFQFTQFFALTKSSIWRHLTDPNEMLYIPGFAVIVYASWVFNALEILASLLLLVPLLRKSRSFLKFVRVYLVFSLIYSIVEIASGLSLRYALTQRLPENLMTGPMLDKMYWISILKIVGFLVTFIWFRYFTTSERVKRTFIN